MQTSIIKIINNETDTLALAEKFSRAISNGVIIFLSGELGLGKTTFVRGILRGFGFTGKVKSPTYTLLEPYDHNDLHIYHFDLYRLQNPEELRFIGIEEYFDAKNICLIEWPEKGSSFLPAPDIQCFFSFINGDRQIKIQTHSPQGQHILVNLG